VRAHPEVKSKGNAAMYGMMAKIPFRGMVKGAVQKIFEDMYGPKPGAKPSAGPVEKFLEKNGEQVMAVLDRVEKARDFIRSMR
jgi:sphinganine-1-phosphate aldolase